MSGKLLWASPWNPTSAIASFGLEVTRELERLGFQIDILRTEVGDALALESLPTSGQVYCAEALHSALVLDHYDSVIFNLGNYYAFHGGALPVLKESAPLVILHDAWMGDFLCSWRHAVGPEAWRVDGLIADLGGDASGLTSLCAVASGAIVHGPHYRDQVEAACPGPVASIPLAYTFEPIAPPVLGPGRLVIATIGHINPNKRADQVIRAIGMSSRLRSNTVYKLIGPIDGEERRRLLELAKHYHAPTPHFTGWLPDQDLRLMMEGVDVICCLRDPCYEGGSASLVTALLSSRPTLVSDQAHYAELPDHLVMKCAPGREAADVIAHLEWVLDHSEQARAMGEAARDFALVTRSPKTYAEKLLQVLEEAIAVAPSVRAARRLGKRLAPLGFPPNDPSVARAASNLNGLLGL